VKAELTHRSGLIRATIQAIALAGFPRPSFSCHKSRPVIALAAVRHERQMGPIGCLPRAAVTL